jgi:hypothetical protein
MEIIHVYRQTETVISFLDTLNINQIELKNIVYVNNFNDST